MWNKARVAKTIDHAALRPDMTAEEVKAACDVGIKNKVASVCVRPSDAAAVNEQLKGTGVDLSVVIGFPHGSNLAEVKALEAQKAIDDGAKELDMVMNIGQFLSGNFDYVQKDIEAVVNESKPRNVLVKVILETCYLTPEQIKKACELSRDAGADYVKTSTGFGTGPATPEAIAIMKETVGQVMALKASGGIKNYDDAKGYLEQGCKRLGASATDEILGGAPD